MAVANAEGFNKVLDVIVLVELTRTRHLSYILFISLAAVVVAHTPIPFFKGSLEYWLTTFKLLTNGLIAWSELVVKGSCASVEVVW